jgi:hypothetical protein
VKTYKALKKIVGGIEGFVENAIVETWRYWIKAQEEDSVSKDAILDVVAVGIARDKSVYSKGFCPSILRPDIKRPGILLRNMVQSKLVAEKGPIPTTPTHRLVLLPLPSFWLRGSLIGNRQFFDDWRGKTEIAEGIPFCFYTIVR